MDGLFRAMKVRQHNEFVQDASLHGAKLDLMMDDLNETQPDPKELQDMAIEDEMVNRVLREAQERKRAVSGSR